MRRLAVAAIAALCLLAAPGVAGADPVDPFPTLAGTGLSSVVAAVPIERYAPDTVFVSKSLGLTYVNLDTEWHDVVARDATRPGNSAPWCKYYPADPDNPDAETCPLFWTPLLPPGGADPQGLIAGKSDTRVLGLEDTQVGSTYAFYCSIHPWMVGTIEVVA